MNCKRGFALSAEAETQSILRRFTRPNSVQNSRSKFFIGIDGKSPKDFRDLFKGRQSTFHLPSSLQLGSKCPTGCSLKVAGVVMKPAFEVTTEVLVGVTANCRPLIGKRLSLHNKSVLSSSMKTFNCFKGTKKIVVRRTKPLVAERVKRTLQKKRRKPETTVESTENAGEVNRDYVMIREGGNTSISVTIGMSNAGTGNCIFDTKALDRGLKYARKQKSCYAPQTRKNTPVDSAKSKDLEQTVTLIPLAEALASFKPKKTRPKIFLD